MHRYDGPLLEATFLRRPNRFVSICEVDGEEARCFLPNPGRLHELRTPGRPVLLQEAPPGSDRATDYTHLAFRYNDRWVSVDTHLPNELVHQGLRQEAFPFLTGYERVRREVTYEASRFDLLLEDEGRRPCFVEVKSVTLVVPPKVLEGDPTPEEVGAPLDPFDTGVGLFPDAVSTRGARHVRELADAVAEGYRAVALFLVQRDDAAEVRPHDLVDPDFGTALREARAAGVEVRAWSCRCAREGVALQDEVPVVLP